MASLQTKYDFFQNYEDFQSQNSTSTQRQSLLEEHMKKLPDEIVESFINEKDDEEKTYKIYFSYSSNTQFFERKKAPVFFLETNSLQERAISLQKWRGIVEEVQKDFFTAKLINLTDIGFDEYAEISNDEITHEDKELIKPGAIFYWSIGYSHSSTGQRTRFSDIRFRRIPIWDEKEINIAKEKAQKTGKLIEWH